MTKKGKKNQGLPDKNVQSIKIELKIDYDYKTQNEKLKEAWHRLFGWRFVCQRAANMVSSLKYSLERMKDMIFLVDGVKLKLERIAKDPEGMLHTSNQNTGYQVLSGDFKGQVPASMLSRINNLAHAAYQAERKEYWSGQRSLRTSRNTIPIPVTKKDIYNLRWDEERNCFLFELYQTKGLRIPFRINLGKDLQNAKSVLNRILSGELPMSDPSIQILHNKNYNKYIRDAKGRVKLDQNGKKIKDLKKYRINLILPVVFPVKRFKMVPGKAMECTLNVDVPVMFKVGRTSGQIGDAEEYEYRRKAIQGALQRTQKALRFARGGHGRKKKLQKIDDFRQKEKQYVETRIHTYSKRIVEYAVKHNCEYILLIDQEEKEENAKEHEPQHTVIRNWGYYGMIEKITYKAARYGIKVEKVSRDTKKKSRKIKKAA